MPTRKSKPKKSAQNKDIRTAHEVSAQDESFIIAYFDNNMNATRAYMTTHPNANYETARKEGSRVARKPAVKARIEEILQNDAMPRQEVLARLGGMARATTQPFIKISDDGFVFFDFSHPAAKANLHLIKKIKTKRQRFWIGRGEEAEEWEGEWIEVELHDPLRALELIGKYYNMFTTQGNDNAKPEDKPLTIPAEMLTSDYLKVNRDIMAGGHSEYTFDGGRGGLKSTYISEIITALLVNNAPMHALILRQVKDTLRESVYSQFIWAINELGLDGKFKMTTSPMEITYIPTGQKIYFRGADKPESIKSIKPPFGYIGLLWFEEFDQFKGEAAVRNIVQSALRGGDKAYQFKSWNTPRTVNHWVHRYMKTPKANRMHTTASYLNVPADWLGQIFLDEANHLKEVNPDAYDHEYGGIANGVGGMVFDNVELRPITDEEIYGKMENGRMVGGFDHIHMGIDWGYYPDPFSWGKMHYDKARLTLYIFDEYQAHKKSNKQTYNTLVKDKGLQPNDLIIADSAEPKSIGDYKEYGANIRGAEKGPESVNYSMKWLQSLKKIVIDPVRAPKHAQEFTECEHEQTKDGEIISGYPDKNNHGIDDTRYAMNNEWRRRGQ